MTFWELTQQQGGTPQIRFSWLSTGKRAQTETNSNHFETDVEQLAWASLAGTLMSCQNFSSSVALRAVVE